MSVEPLVRLDDSGKTIYFVIFNNVGQVFDFNAGVLAFANLGAAVKPYLAATEYPNAGGAGKSQYIASLDLATINNTAAIEHCTLIAFEQAGGSPAPATDTPRSQPNGFSVQFGKEGLNKFRIQCGVSTDTTSGVVLELQAWLESDEGEVVALTSAATCACQIRQIDAGSDALSITTGDFGNVNSQSIFTHSLSNPALENDRQYRAKFTITQNGVSWTVTKPFFVVP
ncbi:hypothetical protein [Gimesia fumaroli]|uniref:Uncharacterized protein n=1 Tax=Gimesia fumaroli TaxID=2527976 RepID=A0A518ICN8_9PLAN|nr:hypothetical protein [Gimesia fumaroli]QDV50862.1 hypothetical protein Enr17x_29070 [Gimesia fumaroli]